MFAIGMPLAMLFFEPQKTMAISSSLEKRRRRLTRIVIPKAGGKHEHVEGDDQAEVGQRDL